MKIHKAAFGAGCFWHVEEAFRTLKGVTNTTVGYMGGTMKNPTYEDVCSHTTGHIEVCQVEYDPKIVSYGQLLKTFWKIHDPTEFERQGLDIGSQYKSVIFYHDESQKKMAIESKDKEQKRYKNKIMTEIVPSEVFYIAEEYHQKYLMILGRKSCPT